MKSCNYSEYDQPTRESTGEIVGGERAYCDALLERVPMLSTAKLALVAASTFALIAGLFLMYPSI